MQGEWIRTIYSIHNKVSGPILIKKDGTVHEYMRSYRFQLFQIRVLSTHQFVMNTEISVYMYCIVFG